MYSKAVNLNNFKGYYIRNCLTFYRQYNQNNSRILNNSLIQKKFDLREKINHYQYFSKFGINYEKKIKKLRQY